MDNLLDRADRGPWFLKIPEIAGIVVNAIQDSDRRFHRYDLHAFVVMPNHVHMLITPHVTSRHWLGPLKGFTAHEAIRTLNLPSGTRFWQPESFDRLIDDDAGCERVKRYIEWNPVKAGLVFQPEDFPYSSASVLTNAEITPPALRGASRRAKPGGGAEAPALQKTGNR
jgi:REP element-mobilizing transposase RayT